MNIAKIAPGLASLLALTVACGDDVRTENDVTSGTSNVTSVSDTDITTTGADATTGADSGMFDTSTSAATGDSGGECQTIQCGGECCDDGEECVLGQCLPNCATEIRCGTDLSVCCNEGEVCLQPDCVEPGQPCLDSYDCPVGEFCEPTLEACLPQPGAVDCEVLPDFEDVDIALEWSFEEEESISIPLVADVDGDGVPEVVMNTTNHDDDGDNSGEGFLAGTIVVLDGQTGQVQLHIENDPPNSYGSYGRSTVGVADVDGNSLPDIVYTGRPLPASPEHPVNFSIIYAVNGLGQQLWSSHDWGGDPHYFYVRQGGPSFGNFDSDPESEVVLGASLIDNDGLVVWDEGGDGAAFGSNNGYRGGLSAVVDLTGDGYPEIVSGRHAWSVTWSQPMVGPPDVTVDLLWDAGEPDGYPAIGDLDMDGNPEVVLVGRVGGETAGVVRVLDGATGQLWCGVDPTGVMCQGNQAARTQPLVIPGEGRGGPPTIADFDGDGRPEIGVAGGTAYSVLDLNRQGENVVQPGGFLPPAPGDIYVRWMQTTQDETSNATGSSVFDFQGDGESEVLYNDECYMRIYDGSTGETILEPLENASATIHEYPIVADVDADGNSEILVVANDANQSVCENIPNYQFRHGLFVYGDPGDQWVRTRRVWNMHTYHVTNSDSRGNVPPQEQNNWTQDGLNNYRQNSQGEGIFNAPDLSVDLSVGLNTCLDEEFELVATVRNEGALGVPAGIEVSLYEGMDASGMFIGTEVTTEPLLPGAFVNFVWLVPAPGGEPKNFYVSVDGADGGAALVTECNENNNEDLTETVACPVPG